MQGFQVSLEYLLAGLVGEAWEVAEKVKKRKRGDYVNVPDALFSNDLILELGDCIWYPFCFGYSLRNRPFQFWWFRYTFQEKYVPCNDLTAACVPQKATVIAGDVSGR